MMGMHLCVLGGRGGGNSMFIVLMDVLVLISMLFWQGGEGRGEGCFYQMCCLLLYCGTTGKFL